MPDQTRRDRFVAWPLYCGLGILAFSCLMLVWPVAQISFSILFLVWAVPFAVVVLVVLIAVIFQGGAALVRRQWQRLASIAVFPGILLATIPAVRAADYVANWLMFLSEKGKYLAEIDEAARHGRRVVIFDWGGNAMIGANRFVVWIAEEETDRARSHQLKAWRQEAGDVGDYRLVQSLGPHFILVEE